MVYYIIETLHTKKVMKNTAVYPVVFLSSYLRIVNTTPSLMNSFILYCRCLFWIYLLMMLSTTVGCLIIFPLTKDTVEMGDDVIPAVNDAT